MDCGAHGESEGLSRSNTQADLRRRKRGCAAAVALKERGEARPRAGRVMLTRGLGVLGVCVYGVGVYAWVVISGSERERERGTHYEPHAHARVVICGCC